MECWPFGHLGDHQVNDPAIRYRLCFVTVFGCFEVGSKDEQKFASFV